MAAKTEEKLVGRITHYYSHLGVGIIELTGGELKVGDIIHVKGKHTDFTQSVDSIQIEHQDVTRREGQGRRDQGQGKSPRARPGLPRSIVVVFRPHAGPCRFLFRLVALIREQLKPGAS